MLTPTILFRRDFRTEEELVIAKKYFNCVELRTEVPRDSLVIARYSALPYYKYLEKDLLNLGSKLVNSFKQHCWIADFEYYEDVKDFTFKTWKESEYPYSGYTGPIVVKGKTNSRKHSWNTHMFAKDRADAIKVASQLANDSLIGEQGLIYRQYVPLKTFEIGLNGLKFTNEFRFFFYKSDLISYGYYWSEAEHPEKGTMTTEGIAFAEKIAKIASKYVNFFVLDIAEKEEGGWVLVEINDAQQSGLSMNDPDKFYSKLKAASILAIKSES